MKYEVGLRKKQLTLPAWVQCSIGINEMECKVSIKFLKADLNGMRGLIPDSDSVNGRMVEKKRKRLCPPRLKSAHT